MYILWACSTPSILLWSACCFGIVFPHLFLILRRLAFAHLTSLMAVGGGSGIQIFPIILSSRTRSPAGPSFPAKKNRYYPHTHSPYITPKPITRPRTVPITESNASARRRRSSCPVPAPLRQPVLAIALILLMAAATAMTGCGPSNDDNGQPDKQERLDIGLVEHNSTRYYTYRIEWPPLIQTHAVLRRRLLAEADSSKAAFLARADRDTMPQTATYPWQLQLTFTVHDSTDRFISVLGKGYSYTGGAHGMSFFKTLNYDRGRGRFIDLRDLLRDSVALIPIRDYVRDTLAARLVQPPAFMQDSPKATANFIERSNKWIAEGTAASFSNYPNALLTAPSGSRSGGLTLIFSPYQVAPYAAGAPRVFVPLRVFRDGLAAPYRGWLQP